MASASDIPGGIVANGMALSLSIVVVEESFWIPMIRGSEEEVTKVTLPMLVDCVADGAVALDGLESSRKDWSSPPS